MGQNTDAVKSLGTPVYLPMQLNFGRKQFIYSAIGQAFCIVDNAVDNTRRYKNEIDQASRWGIPQPAAPYCPVGKKFALLIFRLGLRWLQHGKPNTLESELLPVGSNRVLR